MRSSLHRRRRRGSLRALLALVAVGAVLLALGAGAAGATEGESPQPTADTTPPVITFVQPEPGHAFNWAQTLDFTVTDDTDPAPVVESNYPLGHLFSAEGTYTLVVTAADSAGNTGSATLDFAIDRTRPLTTVEVSGTPGDEGWYTTPVVLTARSTDDRAGVHHNEYMFGMGWRWADTVSRGDGVGWVAMRGVDWAHNEAIAVRTLVKVDTVPPDVTHSAEGSRGLEGWYVSPVTVSVAVTDSGSGPGRAEFAHGAASWLPYTDPFEIGSPGTTCVGIRGYDVAGNVTGLAPIELRIDTAAPEISCGVPEGTRYGYGDPAVLTFGAFDAVSGVASVRAWLDGAETHPGMPIGTEPGAHRLVIEASDRAGNVRRLTRDYAVLFGAGDWLPPVSLTKTWTAGRMLPLKFTVLDYAGRPTGAARALVEVRLNDATVEIGEASVVADADGRPYYQYNLKTPEGDLGPLAVRVALSDGATTMTARLGVCR